MVVKTIKKKSGSFINKDNGDIVNYESYTIVIETENFGEIEFKLKAPEKQLINALGKLGEVEVING